MPKRTNIVLSNDPTFSPPNCLVFNNLKDALLSQDHETEIMIIGGAQLYAQTINMADKLYLTIIDKYYDGDTFFPEYDLNKWQVLSNISKTHQNITYKHLILQRT